MQHKILKSARATGWSHAALAGLLATTAFPTIAMAQDQAGDAEAASSSDGVGEIIVTAQRRSENLQKSSLSVDVVSAEEVTRAGVTDAFEINRLAPGVQVGQLGGFTQVYVRGVGTTSSNQFGDPTVTFNQDGVVIDRPNMIGPLFYDIERIEVVKGPQGTLYGRNATGGAVNVLSRAPGQTFGGFASAQYGNYHNYVVTAALNVPVTAALATRFSGQITGRDSYLEGGFPAGGYRSSRSQAGRAQLLWSPSPALSLRLMGELSNESGSGDNSVLISPNESNSDPWLGAANPVANAAITGANPAMVLIRSDDNYIDKDLWSVSAQLDWDLGFATLTVIPAYRDLDMISRSYDGGLRLDYAEKSQQTTVEARLAHSGDSLKWLLGAFYFNNDRSVFNEVFNNPASQYSRQVFSNIGSSSYALFADGSVSLTDGLRVLGGIRFTHERKTVDGVRQDLDNSPSPTYNIDNSRDFDQVTWRAGLEYDLSPSAMAYATVATGFKSGGFFTSISPGNEFEPEQLTAYTVGVRSRFLDNKLQLNLEGFLWKYNDNQQSVVGFDRNGNIAFVTYNAGNATLYGFSADLVGRVTASDTLTLNVEYNHSNYDRFTYEIPFFFDVNRTSCPIGPAFTPTGGGVNRRTVDCSGRPLPRAPELSLRGGYEHVEQLSGGGKLTLNATGNYQSSKFLTIDYLAQGKVDASFTADASLSYSSPGDKFELSAFVRNLTNAAVYTGGVQHVQFARVFYASINPPRTYGIRAQVNF